MTDDWNVRTPIWLSYHLRTTLHRNDCLGMAASRVVSPPRLAESPVAFECRTLQVMRLAPGVAGGANVVVGEIVHVYVRDDIVDEEFHVLPDRLPAIGRLGGLSYCSIQDRFDLPRGRAALIQDDL